jgi:hypothetical protein
MADYEQEELNVEQYQPDVANVREQRLCEKDWKILRDINGLLEKLSKKPGFYGADPALDAPVAEWLSTELSRKYQNVAYAPFEFHDDMRKEARCIRFTFESKNSNRTESAYLLFHPTGQHPPAIMPPGILTQR